MSQKIAAVLVSTFASSVLVVLILLCVYVAVKIVEAM